MKHGRHMLMFANWSWTEHNGRPLDPVNSHRQVSKQDSHQRPMTVLHQEHLRCPMNHSNCFGSSRPSNVLNTSNEYACLIQSVGDGLIEVGIRERERGRQMQGPAKFSGEDPKSLDANKCVYPSQPPTPMGWGGKKNNDTNTREMHTQAPLIDRGRSGQSSPVKFQQFGSSVKPIGINIYIVIYIVIYMCTIQSYPATLLVITARLFIWCMFNSCPCPPAVTIVDQVVVERLSVMTDAALTIVHASDLPVRGAHLANVGCQLVLAVRVSSAAPAWHLVVSLATVLTLGRLLGAEHVVAQSDRQPESILGCSRRSQCRICPWTQVRQHGLRNEVQPSSNRPLLTIQHCTIS